MRSPPHRPKKTKPSLHSRPCCFSEYLYKVMKFNKCSIPDEVRKLATSKWEEKNLKMQKKAQKFGFGMNSELLSLSLSAGNVHDSLPLVLPVALAQQLHELVQWQGPANAAMGPGIQVGISLSLSQIHSLPFNGNLHPPFSHSKFDLYTKTTELPDIEKLKPYYQSLIDKYCPGVLKWWKRPRGCIPSIRVSQWASPPTNALYYIYSLKLEFPSNVKKIMQTATVWDILELRNHENILFPFFIFML